AYLPHILCTSPSTPVAYTLSLHDALPISLAHIPVQVYPSIVSIQVADEICRAPRRERKSHGPNHSRFRVAVKERLPVLSPEVRILSCTPDNQHKHGRN